ncbi:FliM/FliN family flagellar motor C-terminal domain-containing protein [Paracoccus aerodenitrificans]|uniref:FliM/FliN family flagellar motor C-terminal domain-containing protein n=1 Tax=Paracoccus aerodenitrificans TaxID=3017781 RepID=UPI0022F02956|nr:FliM/FliN family flagellar motor C-terminal domain-containing protein [Paracoccus aerodenitrificans]WBU64179.1 FliM/FliN family flagellar motor C-terminal domain-containing protein [Paracoccus aerodenitrificans]
MTQAAGEKESLGGNGPAGSAGAGKTVSVLVPYLQKRRKTRADPNRAEVPRLTPERAVATAIGRAAQKNCGLPVYPKQSAIAPATLAELVELLPDRALTIVVEDVTGGLGVIALCPSMLSAVIEMQALGRVSSRMPPERRPTRTDAAICADFVNLALSELFAELTAAQPGAAASAYRFASFVDDPKPLELMLEDIAYRRFQLDLKIGEGGLRDATFLAFLPDNMSAHLGVAGDPPECTQIPSIPASRSLSAAVQAAPLTLSAILCRRRMTLRELRSLEPGTVLSLPHGAIFDARLETREGQVVARGKLGALHGSRAIRILASGNSDVSGSEAVASAESVVSGAGSLAEAESSDDTGNVFASVPSDAADMDKTMDQPGIGDLALPDPFRPDGVAEEGEMGDLSLPLNFAVE